MKGLKRPLSASNDTLEVVLIQASMVLLRTLQAVQRVLAQNPRRPGIEQIAHYMEVSALALVSATDIAAGREATFERRKREADMG